MDLLLAGDLLGALARVLLEGLQGLRGPNPQQWLQNVFLFWVFKIKKHCRGLGVPAPGGFQKFNALEVDARHVAGHDKPWCCGIALVRRDKPRAGALRGVFGIKEQVIGECDLLEPSARDPNFLGGFSKDSVGPLREGLASLTPDRIRLV